MTWSKAWESTSSVTDAASLYLVIDEYIKDFLPTRGWSISTMPSGTPADYTSAASWWVQKTRTCFGGVTHLDAFQLWHQPGTDDYEWVEWDGSPGGVTDSIPTSQAADGVIGEHWSINASTFGGKWETWTSDQDTESFFLICRSTNKFMTMVWPAGSLFKPEPSTSPYYTWIHYPPCLVMNDFHNRGHNSGNSYATSSPWLKYTTYNQAERTRPYLTQYPTISGGQSTSSNNFHAGRCSTNDVYWFGTIGNESPNEVVNASAQVFDFNGKYYIAAMADAVSGLFFDVGTTDPGLTP